MARTFGIAAAAEDVQRSTVTVVPSPPPPSPVAPMDARRPAGAGAAYVSASPPDGVAPLTEQELVERFWGRVSVFAARRLNDSAAAQDVAQETMHRVIEALRAGRIGNLAALPGFVFQTARHLCLHSYRSAGREARALSRLATEEPSPDATTALARLVSAEQCQAVRAALEQLEEPDRQLLRLLYFEDADPAVVARQLAVSSGALRVRKHRALSRLAQLLGRQVPLKHPSSIGNH
jgi:RNA polymerase sigma-70 factor, ECF subfamily